MNSLHPPHTAKPAPRLNPRAPHVCSDLLGGHTSGHGHALPTPMHTPPPPAFPPQAAGLPAARGAQLSVVKEGAKSLGGKGRCCLDQLRPTSCYPR